MFRYFLIAFTLLLHVWNTYGQDGHKSYNVNTDVRSVYEYGRYVVDTLTSRSFHGRGYTFDANEKSALFIATEMYNFGMKRFKTAMTFYQNFNMSVNVFPDDIYLALDESFLNCGLDFLPSADCPDVKGAYDLVWLDSAVLSSEAAFKKFSNRNFGQAFIVMDDKGITDEGSKKVFQNMRNNPFGARGLIYLKDKMMWTVSTDTASFPTIDILRSKITHSDRQIRLNINTQYIQNFNNRNVIAYVEGKEQPDTFIIVSAHYDHLGQIGRGVYFPGANDNASGVAMMLSLARHYSKKENQPEYSMVFIGFGAEEAGIIGSMKYVFAPIVPLERTKFVLNMDIMGTGEEGITVVNATEFPGQFALLDSINHEKRYLTQIRKRGPAANSDHYFFYEKGVPCFFIYTMGGIKAYHDPFDRGRTLPLNEFEHIHDLMVDFINKL